MENNKEITIKQYVDKILEVAYYKFPLVPQKETVSNVVEALIKEKIKLMLEAQGNYIAKKMPSINMMIINLSNDFINQNTKK